MMLGTVVTGGVVRGRWTAASRGWIKWEPLKEGVDDLGMSRWTWAGVLGSG
ncbi:hypothetical protein ACLOJK_015001 [Asimina triloba]